MAVCVYGVQECRSGFGEYQLTEGEALEGMNTVRGYVRHSRREQPELRRDRKAEREIGGRIQNQCGRTVLAFREKGKKEVYYVVVEEHYEPDEAELMRG